jgi:hypothetical protein
MARSSAVPSPTVETVPARAVSVPALVLGSQQIDVGDGAEQAVEVLAAVHAELVKTVHDLTPLGAREIRTYAVGLSQFVMVIEPFERRGTLRVAAIYLQ